MVKVLHGTAGNDLLLGDQLDNNVFLDLGAGRDIAIGGAKNDRFVMTTVDHGVDRIDGGAGEDTIDFRASDHALHINLATGEVDANFGGSNPFNIFNPPQWAEVAEVRNVEDVVGSRFDDSITGSAANNRLDGGAGNDVIHAGAGNDDLIGGTGNNVLDGGSGSDTADYSSSSHMVIASLEGGVAGEVDISSTAPAQEFSHDTLVSIENLTGSAQGDWLMGDANANVINGGGGDDQLDGHGGGDTIHGGLGDDYVNEAGASGVNHLFGDAGDDHIFGGDGGDIIDGGIGNDEIFGGSGQDVITGGDGDDYVNGGAGADTMDGGSGVNTLSYQFSLGGVTVNLGADTASDGDTFSNFQNVMGSAHNDLLIGSNQDNVLFESAGTNALIGGGGHDTFAFMDFTESHDLVMDFHIGEDKLAIVGNDTMADLHFTQTGAGTVVSFDNGQTTITLLGVNAQDFVAHSSTDIVFSQTLDPLMHG